MPQFGQLFFHGSPLLYLLSNHLHLFLRFCLRCFIPRLVLCKDRPYHPISVFSFHKGHLIYLPECGIDLRHQFLLCIFKCRAVFLIDLLRQHLSFQLSALRKQSHIAIILRFGLGTAVCGCASAHIMRPGPQAHGCFSFRCIPMPHMPQFGQLFFRCDLLFYRQHIVHRSIS